MKRELNQMKAIVSQMGNQIMILSQELERTVKNSVKEIVEIVVKTIHNSKASEITSGAETKTDSSVQCDLCEFNCENENIMIAHMSDKHETRYSCDLCGWYFGTHRSQVEHNKATHKENYDFTESESEDMIQTKGTEDKKHQKEKKQKNKKKRARK